jgi:hypothetical protein
MPDLRLHKPFINKKPCKNGRKEQFMFIKIKQNIRWLLRKRIRDRGLLFTRDNIRIDREIDHDDDYACAYIEVWFDPEKKFGLKLGEEEYVNVYAFINSDTGDVRVEYVIYYADGFIDSGRKFTALTQDEKNLILAMVDEVSLTETGMSVKENWTTLINDNYMENTVVRSDSCEIHSGFRVQQRFAAHLWLS